MPWRELQKSHENKNGWTCAWGTTQLGKETHRNSTSIFGCLSLRVVEVSGDGNNRLSDRPSQETFRCLLHLRQNHGTNLSDRKVGESWLGAGGGKNRQKNICFFKELDEYVEKTSSDGDVGIPLKLNPRKCRHTSSYNVHISWLKEV